MISTTGQALAERNRPWWSPEASVLLRPATGFRALPRDGSGAWLLLRRPLLLAFVIGCGVSALAAGHFTLRLILDGAVSFAFVPAIHVLALALAVRGARPRDVSVARAIDLFFTGNGPWLLWVIGVAAIGAVVPPRELGSWFFPLLASALIPLTWSLWIDFHVFRDVLNRSAAGALAGVALERAIAWPAVTLYFLYNALWPLEQALMP